MRKIASLLVVLLTSTFFAFAQVPIKGKVIDSKDGVLLDGVSVKVKGTTVGTSTDANGLFTINVPTLDALLEFSRVGYESKVVKASRAYVISLVQDNKSMSEVVVTALNIKREKRSLTYATETIGGDQMNKTGSGNPLSELSGKAAGLTVINSSGDPGSGTYIRLRGVTSISGDNQPLMVVDGIPIDNSINNYDPTSVTPDAVGGANGNLTGGTQPSNRGIDINPNDIESITVLKGPTAAALYGESAANGALIITTKKGSFGNRAGKTSISFSSSVGFDKTNRLPELQSKYAQGDMGELDPSGKTRFSWGPSIDTLYWNGVPDAYDVHGALVGKSDPSAKIPVTPYNRYNFFQTGLTLNNNISLTGGNETSTFRLSLGNVNQRGVIPKTKYNKSTVSVSGQSKLNKKLTIAAAINFITSANDKPQQGSNLSGVMLGLLRTPATFDNSNGVADPAGNELAYILPDGSGLQRNYRHVGIYDNPYFTVNRNPFHENLNRIYGYTQATYQLLDWMILTYRLGGDSYSQDAKNFYDIGSNAFPKGKGIINDYFNSQYNSDFMVEMKKDFNKDLSWSLLLGHNYFYQTSTTRTTLGDGLIAPDFFDMSNAVYYNSAESDQEYRKSSIYGDARLSYKNMLYAEVTDRRTTSSTLAPQHRNFNYPSIGLGWIFTELPTVKSKLGDILSYGKIRTSYAEVAKDAPAKSLIKYPYSRASFNDGFTNGIQFPVNINGVPIGSDQITSATSVIGNPDLKPEITKSYELGLDMGFLKNKINLTATYYYSKTNGEIFTVPYPYSSGFSSKLINAGDITNKGVELSLNTTPIKTTDFKWDITLTWSKNKNMVEKLYNGVNKILIAGFTNGEVDAVAGKPFGQIYGNIYVRANATSSNPNSTSGALLISDDASDPNAYGRPIVGSQNAVIGDVNPKWTGSVTNTLTYKDFTLSAQIDIKYKGDIWNGTRGALDYIGTAKETENRGATTVFSGLTGHLDANGNVVHGISDLAGPGAANTVVTALDEYYWTNMGSSFNGPSEASVEDGSYIKLRQLSLTYALPQSFIHKARFTNLSVTFYMNNIILWTKYKGVDPETSLSGPANGQGLDYFNNPGIKTYGVRLNLGL